MYVFLYKSDDAVEHRLDVDGVTTTGSGNPQTWGPSTFTVPDAKSLSCTIRVRDAVLAGIRPRSKASRAHSSATPSYRAPP